jgi:GrpB-like predicted nucleotidyltransferase (UPF0157 family)
MTRRDPIEIVPYRDEWPALFERERSRVELALLPWLTAPVEHIGSTAVPGLAAKPIIDMLARVPAYDGGDFAAALATVGWTHAPEPGDEPKRKWSFCFPVVAWRTHHLHIHEDASPFWPTLLTLRDHLRTHPADAAEYARLKQALATDDAHDRPRYRAGKAPFIEHLLQRATGR